jgi:outer membrane protein
VIWPTVKAIGQADYFDPVVPGFEKAEFRAIALISFPLYQGGAEFTAIRHQRVVVDDASMGERRLRRDITEQVKSAELELEAAQNTYNLSQDQIRDARENYDLVQNQFKLGAATPLEVANAQANLSEAETQNLVAGYQQQLALYELLFATGQLQL